MCIRDSRNTLTSSAGKIPRWAAPRRPQQYGELYHRAGRFATSKQYRNEPGKPGQQRAANRPHRAVKVQVPPLFRPVAGVDGFLGFLQKRRRDGMKIHV